MTGEQQKSRKGVHSPTLLDIATRVGVCQGTVSAVLNDAPRARNYAPETRNRILQVAQELHYVPNPLGRALKRTLSGTIGCISFNEPDVYYGHVLRGAEETFREQGYELVTGFMNYDRAQFDKCLNKVAAWRVEGLLLMMGGRPLDAEMAASLAYFSIPYLSLDTAPMEGMAPPSRLDYTSGCLIAGHLAEMGHRQIAVLGVNDSNAHATDRVKGITATLRRERIRLPARRIVKAHPGIFGPHAGYVYTGQIIERDPSVTALICINDICAIGALRWLHEYKYRIPEDISVAGFDDVCTDVTVGEMNRLGAYLWPSLTTVRVPHREMGRAAALGLVRRIRAHEFSEALEFTQTVELIVRGSTGPVPSR